MQFTVLIIMLKKRQPYVKNIHGILYTKTYKPKLTIVFSTCALVIKDCKLSADSLVSGFLYIRS